MEMKVYIGVGHGGSDPGAVANGFKEKDLNLAIALACQDELARHGVLTKMSRTTDENDTTAAKCAECNQFDPDVAVDIHNNAGGGDGAEVFYSIYGGTGKVLAENISTIGGNTTRFAVIAKRGLLNESCKKISILFTLPDESGALSHVLSVFADNGLNLVKIESKPSHDGNFEYMFFVDFEGSLLDDAVNGIMAEVLSHTSSLKVLGNYSIFEK